MKMKGQTRDRRHRRDRSSSPSSAAASISKRDVSSGGSVISISRDDGDVGDPGDFAYRPAH
jgi:hypothetical protein